MSSRLLARLRIMCLACLAALIPVSCSRNAPQPVDVQPVVGMPSGTNGYPWWNDAVFYQIFVRSFYDSNGDGNGDLKGVIEKLDYLNDGNPETTTDLGVNALWLLPLHPASTYHGYDVTDYSTIHPDYGMLQDFQQLLDEAHRRGMRVVIDLVLNHTSSEHAWFVSAGDKTSRYRSWYVWSATEPVGAGWHKAPSGYYYGNFGDGMPDLNYENPEVTAQMQDVARYWLEEVGVDGFRLDAIKHLVEDGVITANADQTHSWLADFRPFYKAINPQAMTVGEVWEDSVTVSKYLKGDELDIAFDFDLAEAAIVSARTGKAAEYARILSRDLGLFPPGQFATFLTNHDQARTMLVLGENPLKARVAAALLLTSPGVPFIYYGEEIGMIGKKPDENIRTPMQWSADFDAGFSSATPWRPVNPDYPEKNVALQTGDAASLLAYYCELVGLRNRHVALRLGETIPLETGHPAIYAILRHTENESLLVVTNLSELPVADYALSVAESPLSGAYQVARLFGTESSKRVTITPPALDAKGGFSAYRPLAELPPGFTLILQLQLLER